MIATPFNLLYSSYSRLKKKTLPEQLDRVIDLLEWMKKESINRKQEWEDMHKRQLESFRKESDINVNNFKRALIEGLEQSGMRELADAARRKRLEEEEWKKRISGGS